MALPISQYPTHVQGTATAGNTAIFTGPAGYVTTISGITFNSQAANDLTVRVIRTTPASTVIAYAFTLAAGDVVSDNNQYTLAAGDSLEIITTAATTNYMFTANSTAATAQRIVYQ
jgi:hypothetical protein